MRFTFLLYIEPLSYIQLKKTQINSENISTLWIVLLAIFLIIQNATDVTIQKNKRVDVRVHRKNR